METRPAHNLQQIIPRETRQNHSLELVSSGIQALDDLLGGGLPKGAISEICGPPSSGATALLMRILAAATGRQQRVAYIDTYDCFDPPTASRSGLQLENFLWLRCHSSRDRSRTDQALQAADILSRSEGFDVIVLDLAAPPGSRQPSLPLHCWFRLKRILRGQPSLLLVVADRPLSASAARVVLSLQRCHVHWHAAAPADIRPNHSLILRGVRTRIRLTRGKGNGQTVLHCHF